MPKKRGKGPKSEAAPAIVIPRAAPAEEAKKEIPFGFVLLVGVLIWVLIFGTIFSYAAVAPCSFVAVTIGERKTLESLSERLSMNFTDDAQCRHFLRMTVVAPGLVVSETGAS